MALAILAGLVWLGICVDHGLTNIARVMEKKR